jgi:hypothetical protein
MNGKMPPDYKDFLLYSDGAEGYYVDWCVQLNAAREVIEWTQNSDHLREDAPNVWMIGGIGGGDKYYFIDCRPGKAYFMQAKLWELGDSSTYLHLGDSMHCFLSNLWELAVAKRDGREPIIKLSLEAQ